MSSGGGQEVKGLKREGPSEYEINLENKNKQVCLFPSGSICSITGFGVKTAGSSTLFNMSRGVCEREDFLTKKIPI